MRNSDCYKLAKVLLPQLPGFVTSKKNEIFIAPVGHVLRGFLFESSAYAREDFYFWWFFMPIGRPIDYLTLGYGRRLNVPGGHAGWRTDMEDLPGCLLEAIRPMALPLLNSVQTSENTIDAIYDLRGETVPGSKLSRQVKDINVQDDLACLHILGGQFDAAKIMLDKIIAHEHGTDRRQWVLNIVERMKGLRTKLIEDPQLAVNQVMAWQDFTFKALKLEKWR
jgi:hypothetical protein